MKIEIIVNNNNRWCVWTVFVSMFEWNYSNVFHSSVINMLHFSYFISMTPNILYIYIYIYIYSIQNCHLTFLNSCHNIYLYSWIINISMIFHVTSLSLTAKQITGIFSLRYKKQLFFRSPDLPSIIFCDTLSHLTSRKKFRSHFFSSASNSPSFSSAWATYSNYLV